MTLTQIHIVLACESTGSISKAAQQEFTSISNLSKMLKLLEDELGFPIFIRDNNGVRPTESGKRFLLHAHSIMNECMQIKRINPAYTSCNFSCTCHQANPYAISAFTKLCREYEAESSLLLAMYSANFPECIERVLKRQADIAVVQEHNQEIITDEVVQHGLFYRYLGSVTPSVYLRSDHPLITERHLDETKEFGLLKAYPYVDYFKWNQNDYQPTYRTFGFDVISLSRMILVGSPSLRVKIAKSTNAFFMGIENVSEETDGLVRIPLPGCETRIYYICSKDYDLSSEAKRYIEILTQELKAS